MIKPKLSILNAHATCAQAVATTIGEVSNGIMEVQVMQKQWHFLPGAVQRIQKLCQFVFNHKQLCRCYDVFCTGLIFLYSCTCNKNWGCWPEYSSNYFLLLQAIPTMPKPHPSLHIEYQKQKQCCWYFHCWKGYSYWWPSAKCHVNRYMNIAWFRQCCSHFWS